MAIQKTFSVTAKKPVTTSNALDEREPATSFAVIPYIQGVTETIKRILNSHNVKVAQKPFQTLRHIFAKPKDPVTKEQRPTLTREPSVTLRIILSLALQNLLK